MTVSNEQQDPSGTPETHVREKTVFLEALDIEQPKARQVFLDKTCGSDAHLRQRVTKLLEVSSSEIDLLDTQRYTQLIHERDVLTKELAAEGAFLSRLSGSVTFPNLTGAGI